MIEFDSDSDIQFEAATLSASGSAKENKNEENQDPIANYIVDVAIDVDEEEVQDESESNSDFEELIGLTLSDTKYLCNLFGPETSVFSVNSSTDSNLDYEYDYDDHDCQSPCDNEGDEDDDNDEYSSYSSFDVTECSDSEEEEDKQLLLKSGLLNPPRLLKRPVEFPSELEEVLELELESPPIVHFLLRVLKDEETKKLSLLSLVKRVRQKYPGRIDRLRVCCSIVYMFDKFNEFLLSTSAERIGAIGLMLGTLRTQRIDLTNEEAMPFNNFLSWLLDDMADPSECSDLTLPIIEGEDCPKSSSEKSQADESSAFISLLESEKHTIAILVHSGVALSNDTICRCWVQSLEQVLEYSKIFKELPGTSRADYNLKDMSSLDVIAGAVGKRRKKRNTVIIQLAEYMERFTNTMNDLRETSAYSTLTMGEKFRLAKSTNYLMMVDKDVYLDSVLIQWIQKIEKVNNVLRERDADSNVILDEIHWLEEVITDLNDPEYNWNSMYDEVVSEYVNTLTLPLSLPGDRTIDNKFTDQSEDEDDESERSLASQSGYISDTQETDVTLTNSLVSIPDILSLEDEATIPEESLKTLSELIELKLEASGSEFAVDMQMQLELMKLSPHLLCPDLDSEDEDEEYVTDLSELTESMSSLGDISKELLVEPEMEENPQDEEGSNELHFASVPLNPEDMVLKWMMPNQSWNSRFMLDKHDEDSFKELGEADLDDEARKKCEEEVEELKILLNELELEEIEDEDQDEETEEKTLEEELEEYEILQTRRHYVYEIPQKLDELMNMYSSLELGEQSTDANDFTEEFDYLSTERMDSEEEWDINFSDEDNFNEFSQISLDRFEESITDDDYVLDKIDYAPSPMGEDLNEVIEEVVNRILEEVSKVSEDETKITEPEDLNEVVEEVVNRILEEVSKVNQDETKTTVREKNNLNELEDKLDNFEGLAESQEVDMMADLLSANVDVEEEIVTGDDAVLELLQYALTEALSISQRQTLLAEVKKTTRIVKQLGLSPTTLPDLVENNPLIAVDIFLKMVGTPQFDEYLPILIHMKMSVHSMEVVNRLTSSTDLPKEFLHLFISNCISTCESIHDKYVQNRLVRLVCVFLQSLFRNRTTDFQLSTSYELYIEIMTFCLEFSRIREATALYRLMKQLESEDSTELQQALIKKLEEHPNSLLSDSAFAKSLASKDFMFK